MLLPVDPSWHDEFSLRHMMSSRKYQRLLCRITAVLGFGLMVFAIAGITIFDHQHNNIIHEYVARENDIAILSATYYQRSRSFKNDTVVILLNAHQVLHLKHSDLQLRSKNETDTIISSFRIYPVVGQLPFYCKWVPFIAVGQVAADMTSLQLSSGDVGMPVTVRKPYSEAHDVVACFSPLFLNERWELLLLTAEVYSHYGAWMHFYVRSMVSELHQILSVYPNAKLVPWPGVKLGSHRASSLSFNPNVELEFRNQAAAMTDCLLLYKESADFIMFPDADDVIIPRLGYNYFSEFTKVFSMYPRAASVAYNMTQTSISTATTPPDYSPADVLRSVKFKGESRWGKLVVRPELVDSAWIHRSYGIREGYEQVTLPIEKNSALHLRFWSLQKDGRDGSFKRPPKYNPTLTNDTAEELISNSDLREISRNFDERMKDNWEIFTRLPQLSVYYPLIEQCYNRIFYNGEQHSSCKGPELCDLPQFPGIRCMNVEATYETFTEYDSIYIHRLTSAKFKQSNDGCTL